MPAFFLVENFLSAIFTLLLEKFISLLALSSQKFTYRPAWPPPNSTIPEHNNPRNAVHIILSSRLITQRALATPTNHHIPHYSPSSPCFPQYYLFYNIPPLTTLPLTDLSTYTALQHPNTFTIISSFVYFFHPIWPLLFTYRKLLYILQNTKKCKQTNTFLYLIFSQ